MFPKEMLRYCIICLNFSKSLKFTKEKIADALVNDKTIRTEGGNYKCQLQGREEDLEEERVDHQQFVFVQLAEINNLKLQVFHVLK